MAIFADIAPVKTRFVTKADFAQTKSIIRQAIVERSGKLHSETESRLLAKFGSGAKMRLIGGAFIDKLSFAREAAFILESRPDGTQVAIVARDTFGFGSRAGFREKFNAVLAEDVGFFSGKFPDRSVPSQALSATGPLKIFLCPSCKNKERISASSTAHKCIACGRLAEA